MKTYSTKANAKRAAKAAGYTENDYAVYKSGEAWAIEVLDTDFELVAAQEAATVKAKREEAQAALVAEVAAWKSAFISYNPQMLLAAPVAVFNGMAYCPNCNIHLSNGYGTDLHHPEGDTYCLACDHVLETGKLVKSTVDNPVQLVWNIADRMWGDRRKDIIAECVRQGVAYNTARTQYQAFYKVKSQEGK